MPFTFSKVLDHGSSNPIVARLTLQVSELLAQCNISNERRDDVFDVCLNSLVRKLLRCWEIEARLQQDWEGAVSSYKPPEHGKAPRVLPQVARLEEECHNFLYESKNYVRDVLKVFNLLYGTGFVEASEFSKPKRGKQSLVQYSEATFGEADSRTLFFKGASKGLEEIVDMRNAVEHPDGYSGALTIQNIRVGQGGQIAEPAWFRTDKGSQVTEPSAVLDDMHVIINNLLSLGEVVVVSWAAKNLKMPQFMRIAPIPESARDPARPIAWKVAATASLERQLSNLDSQKK